MKTTASTKKDLLNPTPAQIKYRNRKWAEALVANKKKKRNTMYGNGGRCCLAVAQDVACELGIGNYRGCDEFHPHSNIGLFFGWEGQLPGLDVSVKDKQWRKIDAVSLNDGISLSNNKKHQESGLSHAQIAECVLNTYVRPKNKKQTFKF